MQFNNTFISVLGDVEGVGEFLCFGRADDSVEIFERGVEPVTSSLSRRRSKPTELMNQFPNKDNKKLINHNSFRQNIP